MENKKKINENQLQKFINADHAIMNYQPVIKMDKFGKKKIDRITWSLQGRFEHGKITLNKGSWNSEFLDQLLQFPNPQVHDDLIDALSYIEQVQIPEYNVYYEEEEYEPLDTVTGY